MITDKARQVTDKKLSQLERKIAKTYNQAREELTKTWAEYMEQGDAHLSALYASGDKKAYQSALKEYTLTNQHYKEMVEATTFKLANVNKTALAYAKGELPEIYAINYNHMATIYSESGIDVRLGINFTIRNPYTVKRMIIDGDIKLPNANKRLNIPKDQRWNTKQINSSVLQGITQGESMDKIAKRLQPILDNNEAAAIRNARTLVTGAENRGRLDSYEAAQDDGIVLEKQWMATGDGRTRDWHLALDGVSIPIDEMFDDGYGGLMYPGDPSGAPESVYNCRCRMISKIIGFKSEDGSFISAGEPDEFTLHDREIRNERKKRAN